VTTAGLLYVRAVESPIGALLLAASESGLCGLEFGAEDQQAQSIQAWAERHMGPVKLAGGHPLLDEAAHQLEQYFGGKRREFELPLDLRGTEFQMKVWRALTKIPFGQTRSYKEIAEAVGSPKAVRAVGGANNRNPISIIVPCHRVIGSDGALVGYGGGLDIKTSLLKLEGLLDDS
jgi:O-6-methylguanine DNA methyltransferase